MSRANERAKESKVDAASLFMHFIYEHYERKVLTAMVAYCKSIDRKVTALIHDGLHMRLKFGETSIDKELLRGMEKFVLEETDFRITIVEKSLKPTPEDLEMLMKLRPERARCSSHFNFLVHSLLREGHRKGYQRRIDAVFKKHPTSTIPGV
jgi:hypothetical protein